MLLPYHGGKFPAAGPRPTTGMGRGVQQGGRGCARRPLSITALVPPLALVSHGHHDSDGACLGLVAWFGKETRGRDLRDLIRGHTFRGDRRSQMAAAA